MGGRCPRLERLEFGLFNRRPSFRAPDWVKLNFRFFSLGGKGLNRGYTWVVGIHATFTARSPCHITGRCRPRARTAWFEPLRPGWPFPRNKYKFPTAEARWHGRCNRMGAGSPKEDMVAKLIRTAFLIGLAVTWHPKAAAGQYSWSNFSVSAGFGAFGVGASYTSVDPWYDFYYEDPCWDYTYYERYRYACSREFDRIHIRQNYSVVSVNPYRRRWPSYYDPYGYYGSRGHIQFSLSFGLNFGYGYSSPYYAYGYPTYGYGYPAYRVVWYGGNRIASRAIRPARRSSPLVRSSPLYKESPQTGARRAMAARSTTSGTTAATQSRSERRARASGPQRNVRERTSRARALGPRAEAPNRAQSNRGNSAQVRPSEAASPRRADRTDGLLRARRGTSARLYPPSRAATPSRRPSSSSDRASFNTTRAGRGAATASVRPEQPSRAPAAPSTGRSETRVPSRTAPPPTARSRAGGVTRSMPLQERAPATRPAPNARSRASGSPQARTASPIRGRATQPSARPAPDRTSPRAPAARRTPATRSTTPRANAPRARSSRANAPRAKTPRATGQRAATPRSRASSGGASRGAPRARATGAAAGRGPRR